MKMLSPYPTNLPLSKKTPGNLQHLYTQFDEMKSKHHSKYNTNAIYISNYNVLSLVYDTSTPKNAQIRIKKV